MAAIFALTVFLLLALQLSVFSFVHQTQIHNLEKVTTAESGTANSEQVYLNARQRMGLTLFKMWQKNTIWLETLTLIGGFAFCWLFGFIIISHGVAGPVFRISQYFLQESWYTEPAGLREGDNMHFFVDVINHSRQEKLNVRTYVLRALEKRKEKLPDLDISELRKLIISQVPKGVPNSKGIEPVKSKKSATMNRHKSFKRMQYLCISMLLLPVVTISLYFLYVVLLGGSTDWLLGTQLIKSGAWQAYRSASLYLIGAQGIIFSLLAIGFGIFFNRILIRPLAMLQGIIEEYQWVGRMSRVSRHPDIKRLVAVVERFFNQQKAKKHEILRQLELQHNKMRNAGLKVIIELVERNY